MENIFIIGGQVTGDSFIGRKDLLTKFRKNFLESSFKSAKSIVGLPRIGKTSFIKEVFADVPKNTNLILLDVGHYSTYLELWQDICMEISDYIKQNITLFESDDISELEENINSIVNEKLPWVRFMRSVKNIFEILNERRIRTVMVLDEFDHAKNIFNEGTRHFELFRTIFSDTCFNVSAITISRRHLHEIENTTYQSSTFHGVLEPIYFTGFNKNDMNDYYDILSCRYGINLTDKQKNDIEYYAGNLPFLLSVIGHYIVEENDGNTDIVDIFKNKCKAINDYYKDCINQLERDKDLDRLLPFIIGPNIGVTQNDLDEMINLGYLRVVNDNYVAISKHFSNMLSTEIKNNLWEGLISLEKNVKHHIITELLNLVEEHRIYGSNINEVESQLIEITPHISNQSKNMYDSFILNNARMYNRESDYIDVMSLKDCINIVSYNYDLYFKKYYAHANQEEIIRTLFTCSKARNPIAHGHEEYLDETTKAEVNSYCKKYLKMFKETAKNCLCFINEKYKSEILETAKKFKKN